MPERIEALESELNELHERMADPAFYRNTPDEIVRVKSRLDAVQADVGRAYRRWEELEQGGADGT